MAKRIPLVFEGGEIIESKSTDTMDLNNGVVKATGGTAERNLKDILADTLSVKDFGAKGDGETDDTAAFQAAAAKGGTIYVPHGTYKLTEPVSGDFISFGHPSFTGAGATVMDKNCTDLYNDYVHKNAEYLPSGTYEQIYGDKQALGKWNFKGQTIFDGAETHNQAETHNGAENHSGDETHTGNVTFGSAGSNKTIVINVPTEFNGPVDFSGMTDAQKADLLNDLITGGAGDGFEIASGKLKVKTSELIPGTATDGLSIDSNGKIKVAPSELAGTGLTGNDSTGKLTVNVSDLIPGDANDGFEIASNKLKVKPSELISTGGGLIIDNDGKLKTDMAAIAEALSGDSEDAAINSALMLAALGLPVNIPTDTGYTWYVNYEAANATDTPTYAQLIASSGMTNEDIPKGKKATNKASTAYMTAYGWGRNQNYPFKTISGALKFIRTHYSLSNVGSYVKVTPRTATTGDDSYYAYFSAGAYQSAGGDLYLQSSSDSKNVIVQRSMTNGSVAAFTESPYHIEGFTFKALWYGHASSDITTNIVSIVYCSRSNFYFDNRCVFSIDERTQTNSAGTNTYVVNGEAVGIAGTRLIRAINGASVYFYGGTWNITHSNSLPTTSGNSRGNLFYAEIGAYIGFVKKNHTFTWTGSCGTMFFATRQSMLGGYGSGTEIINISNFAIARLFNCQNASGFERNGWGTMTIWNGVPAVSGGTRASDTFGSGSWYDDYTPYTAS